MAIDYLPGNNFIVNENIAIKYGLELAAFLGYLMSADKFFSHNGSGPWFYQTIEEIEKRTGFKEWKQEKLLKNLEELGLIKRKRKGMPAKRYFLINYEKANELSSPKEIEEQVQNSGTDDSLSVSWKTGNKFLGKQETSFLENRKNNIYNNNINNIYKEKENIKEKESIRSSSKNTPSLLATSKKTEPSKEKSKKQKPLKAKEIKNKEIIEEIIAYLNEKANKHFRAKNKEAIKLINGRLSEGYTIADLKAVIDNRVKKWLNDDKMNEYLRPSTLFRPSKFEAYYNDVLSTREKVVTAKEQEFIEKFSISITPTNLSPKQALELFKKEHKIDIMSENDFKKLEKWYEEKIVEWDKKLREKFKKERLVNLDERTKNEAYVRKERYIRNFDKPRKF